MGSVELALRVAWQQHVGTSSEGMLCFDSVVSRHREPARHYHDLRHVGWVVRHSQNIAAGHPVDDLDAVVAAAFFHDAVYEPTRTDNELASARLAERALGEIGWDRARSERVARLVLATTGHALDGADRDTAVLLAADLAVLAAEPARYTEYAAAVRREYAHVDDAGWKAGRAGVLHALLDRPRLFAPDLGLDDWEHRARANITAELAVLEPNDV